MKLYRYTQTYSFLNFEIGNRVYIMYSVGEIGNYFFDKDTYHGTFQSLGVEL